MNEEQKKRIIDYFDPDALVDYLGLTTDDVVEAFQDQIVDCLEDIEEFIKYGR